MNSVNNRNVASILEQRKYYINYSSIDNQVFSQLNEQILFFMQRLCA